MTSSFRGKHVALDVITLQRHETREIAAPADDEAAIILLQGAVTFDHVAAHRTSVFDERASGVYLAPKARVELRAQENAELAIAATVGCALESTDTHPVVVRPEAVVVHDRGRPPWHRTVHDVVADGIPAQRLIVGETFNEPGQWSSFPPHKHDGADGEAAFEEVYYYRFDPPDGFGFQGLYDADGNEHAEFLRHGRIVAIPSGYHPVCAAPGYRMYYLWALVGAQRALEMHEDPAHRWLHDLPTQ
jgi:5-deoxy-glucuronate isomerase